MDSEHPSFVCEMNHTHCDARLSFLFGYGGFGVMCRSGMRLAKGGGVNRDSLLALSYLWKDFFEGCEISKPIAL